MPTKRLRERSFHTGAVALHYAEGPPNGPAMVYLHGGSARWQHGARFVTRMAERWQVYGVDLRGHGRSGWVPGGYRVRDYAADTAAFLRGVVRGPAALYGHSLGGQVARWCWGTSRWPTATPSRSRRAPADQIAAALRELPLPRDGRRAGDAFGADSPWFPFMGETLAQHDPEVLTFVLDRRAEMLDGYDVVALLPRVACPTLLVLADLAAGGQVAEADAARAGRLLPRGERVRLAGIGHPLHATHPEPVARVIDAFLAAHSARAPDRGA